MNPPQPPHHPTHCIACRQPAVRQLADFGPQPVSHHFLSHPADSPGRHPLVLGHCLSCGLAQLINPIPPARLVPHFDWIRYNEPEAHLDSLVDSLTRLPGIHPGSRILGVTYKEDSTLRRLQERGFTQTSRCDPAADLLIPNPCAGVEFVQHNLTPDLVPHLRQRHNTPDLVIVRHVIEHTHNTPAFLQTFRSLVAPNGYVVFELPDCARGFDLLDYTTFWEDHSLYFVESTFRSTLERHGLGVTAFLRFPGAYEQCLVAITQPRTPQPDLPTPALDAELLRTRRFADSFPSRRDAVRRQLTEWRRLGPIALFGAGHQAVTFLALFNLADLVDAVIDDHPAKAGRFMPGSALPIIPSSDPRALAARVWLLTTGAESERRILERHRPTLANGTLAASIYPTVPDSIFTPLPQP